MDKAKTLGFVFWLILNQMLKNSSAMSSELDLTSDTLSGLSNGSNELTEMYNSNDENKNNTHLHGMSRRKKKEELIHIREDIVELKEDAQEMKTRIGNLEEKIVTIQSDASAPLSQVEASWKSTAEELHISLQNTLKAQNAFSEFVKSKLEEFLQKFNQVENSVAELSSKLDQNKLTDDRQFAEIDVKLGLQTDHFFNKLQQVEQTDSKRFAEVEDKSTQIDHLLSEKYIELSSKIKQMELAENNMDLKVAQCVQSISEQRSDLLTQIKQNEQADAAKFIEIEGKISRTEQLVSQQYERLFNFTQNNTPESSSVSKNNFEAKIKPLEESILEKLPQSNRIKDGPLQCRLWPDGKVPFEIDSSLNSNSRKVIYEAINDFHNKTCIRWIPRQKESAFVNFLKYNYAKSSLNKVEECYTGGRRVTTIKGEFTIKEVLRQMAYILGFGDEHLRKDRDENIKVRRSNCTMEDKYPHLNGGGFYGYQSVMHPSCDEETCLQRIDYSSWPCGKRKSLSILDAEKLNEMYNCKGCHSLRFQFPTQIGFNERDLVPVFENAHENRRYICRVYKERWVIIGRGNVRNGECHYEDRGTHNTTENVQFLTNPQQIKLQWVLRDRDFPQNAIPGGNIGYRGNPLYVARCAEEPQWGESVVPRWIDKSDTSMRMYRGDRTNSTCSSFDILTCL